MQKITTFLWFDDQAEQAAKFYVSLFPKSKIETVARYNSAGPGRKGSVMTVTFRLAGQQFIALNGGPHFHFTPAISLSVACKDQKEVDRLWTKLLRGGKPSRCGWLEDRYGLSWQIVPAKLPALVARSPEATKAMLGMVKLDLATIERAAGIGKARKTRR